MPILQESINPGGCIGMIHERRAASRQHNDNGHGALQHYMGIIGLSLHDGDVLQTDHVNIKRDSGRSKTR